MQLDEHLTFTMLDWRRYVCKSLLTYMLRSLLCPPLLTSLHDSCNVKVGVDWDNRKGVHINDFFQTANPDIYAIGDCASAYKFTHSADFQVGLICFIC